MTDKDLIKKASMLDWGEIEFQYKASMQILDMITKLDGCDISEYAQAMAYALNTIEELEDSLKDIFKALEGIQHE